MLEFHYLSHGFQAYWIDGKVYHLRAGDVYVTYPGQSHGTNGLPMGRNTVYYLRLALQPMRGFLGYRKPEAQVVLEALEHLTKQVYCGDESLRDEFDALLRLVCHEAPERSLLVRNAVTSLLFHLIELGKQDCRPGLSHEIEAALVCADADAALAEALKSGKLAGAGLDVTSVEPCPADSPLWSAPNLLLTSHSSAYSQHLRSRKPHCVFSPHVDRGRVW